MHGTIKALIAAALLAAGCASADRGACAELEQACRAQCDRDFEHDPDAWDYQSCLASCRPAPDAICTK